MKKKERAVKIHEFTCTKCKTKHLGEWDIMDVLDKKFEAMKKELQEVLQNHDG